MMKKVIPVMGGIVLFFFPLAGMAILLWVFWDELGSLALAIHDDRSLEKTRKALSENLHADVEIFYAHALSMRVKEAHRRKSRTWSRGFLGKLATAKRYVLRVQDSTGEGVLSAAANAKFCIDYFNGEGRSTIGEPATVPVAVDRDNWERTRASRSMRFS